ncbi:MAG TPA: MerR family transcriptional regulator [Dactylosporangium sp.]|nr:MerR family transcriptional regulator [Dactylosporangium sp.]
MAATEWTLEELIGMVAAVLDGTGYEGAPNGRVQDLPDARAVRWYTSIGLLDRPILRGRNRMYGPRHYLQLVAIKRRQAQGLRIADIQAELANAPDDVLLGIAKLPAGVAFRSPPTAEQRLAALVPDPENPPPRRFWAMPPSEFMPAANQESPTDQTGQEGRADQPSQESRAGQTGQTGRASRGAQASRTDQAGQESRAGQTGQESVDDQPGRERPAGERRRAAPNGRDGLITGVPMGGGAVLLLPETPTEDDIAAIQEAARELMQLLAARGLVEGEGAGIEPQGQATSTNGKARLQDEIEDSTTRNAGATKRRGSAV